MNNGRVANTRARYKYASHNNDRQVVIQFISILAIGYSMPLADAMAFSPFDSWKNYID